MDCQSESYPPRASLEQFVVHRILLEETEQAILSLYQIDEFSKPIYDKHNLSIKN